MIAKISATENLGGALGYNFKKVQHNEASVLCVNELREGFDGTYRIDKVLRDMQALIPEKCRTKKMVFHCSLNPHPDEKLSDEQLTQDSQGVYGGSRLRKTTLHRVQAQRHRP